MKEYEFEQGDAMVFCSYKYHCVSPVTRGTRRVFIQELWAGAEKTFPHRCENRVGECCVGHIASAALRRSRGDNFVDSTIGGDAGRGGYTGAAVGAAEVKPSWGGLDSSSATVGAGVAEVRASWGGLDSSQSTQVPPSVEAIPEPEVGGARKDESAVDLMAL